MASTIPKERLYARVDVPGGVVGIDPYRGRGEIALILRNFSAVVARGGFNARGVLRDVVVLDGNDEVIYREGPYDGMTVDGPFGRITNEIRKHGMGQFVRMRQLADGKIGPVTVPSGRIAIPELLSLWWSWIRSFGSRSS